MEGEWLPGQFWEPAIGLGSNPVRPRVNLKPHRPDPAGLCRFYRRPAGVGLALQGDAPVANRPDLDFQGGVSADCDVRCRDVLARRRCRFRVVMLGRHHDAVGPRSHGEGDLLTSASGQIVAGPLPRIAVTSLQRELPGAGTCLRGAHLHE